MKSRESLSEELRQAFDHSFAHPPPQPRTIALRLLLVELREGRRVALNLHRLTQIHVGRRIVPLPGTPPELLGLAGAQGQVIPVWDLSALLDGTPPQHESSSKSSAQSLSESEHSGYGPRWIAQCVSPEPVGLAFVHLLRQLDLPPKKVLPSPRRQSPWKASIRVDGKSMGVVDLPRLLDSLSARVSPRYQVRKPE